MYDSDTSSSYRSFPNQRSNENDVIIFKRKILRPLVSPVRDGDGWRVRKNRDIDVVRFIKLRLGWGGCEARMGKE